MQASGALLRLAAWPVMVLAARQLVCQPGQSVSRQIVDSGRLLLVASGTIRYTVESAVHLLRAPAMFYVPSWTRRHWNVHGQRRCRVSYVEFVCPDTAVLGTSVLHAPNVDLQVERPAMDRVIAAHGNQTPANQAQAVTELCAILARFVPAASTLAQQPVASGQPAGHQRAAVDRAVRHIASRFHHPDVLEHLADSHGLSDDHFRRLFRQITGLTPHRLVTVYRMREARFLLSQGGQSVKQVAAAVGYDDPLYFSRRYRGFWGHPPKHEAG